MAAGGDRCWPTMVAGLEAPGWSGRRLLITAVLLLLLVTTMLLYRLCYATPGTVVCARAGTGRLHFPHTRRRLPGAIIIGARKAGTRALLEMINVHPQVSCRHPLSNFRALFSVFFFSQRCLGPELVGPLDVPPSSWHCEDVAEHQLMPKGQVEEWQVRSECSGVHTEIYLTCNIRGSVTVFQNLSIWIGNDTQW